MTDWLASRDATEIVVLADTTLLAGLFAGAGICAALRRLDVYGKHPVSAAVFAAGKLCMIASWCAPAARAAGLGILVIGEAAWSRWAGAAALTVAVVLIVASFVQLGAANKFGLPRENADAPALGTRGVYRLSRNPMYLGFLLVCAGSCLYVPHAVNFALGAVAAAVHRRIVLAEERYLEQRFGDEWRAYARRVGRWLPRAGRAPPPGGGAGVP